MVASASPIMDGKEEPIGITRPGVQRQPSRDPEAGNALQAVAVPQDKPRWRLPWRQIVCWVGILIGVVVLAVGLAILILALTFTVADPVVKVSNATISGVRLNRTGSALDLQNFAVYMSGVINVTVSVYNPNKFTINILLVDVGISYSGYTVTNTTVNSVPSISPFQTVSFSIPFTLENVPIVKFSGDASIVSAVIDALRKSLTLQFRILTVGNAVYLGIRSPNYFVLLNCGFAIDLTSGSMGSQECTKSVY